jgi:hypothetical protein
MSDYIYHPKQDTPDITSKQDEFYTITGTEDYQDKRNNPRLYQETDQVLAKKVYRTDGSAKNYIKINVNGNIYNPLSLYGDKTSNFLDRVCKSGSKFREVNQKAFDMYISFLRTKNASWLHNAEREIL